MTPAAIEALERRLPALVERLAAGRGIPHAVVAVESGDGSMRRIAAAGAADPGGRPMTAETPYLIASVTKLFIAAVVLRLFERGLVDLDRPIGDYLPKESVRGLHRLDGVDRTHAITSRHLLRHTSGLPDWLEDRPRGGRPLLDRLLEDGDRLIGLEDVAAWVREELTPHFAPQPLETGRPNVRYSDTNYQLLMAIVEVVSGSSLHEVYRKELFAPLGLRHTWLPGKAPLDPAPEPATVWAGARPVEKPLLLESVRDLYSTASDQIAFLRALVTGTAFDEPSTFGLMGGRFTPFTRYFDRSSFRLPRRPIEYGAGMMRFALPWALSFLWPVPAVVGHTGSTGTWLFYCPEHDLYLAGGVGQAAAAPLPFRFVPRLLLALRT